MLEVEVIELLDTVEYDYPNFIYLWGALFVKINRDLVLKTWLQMVDEGHTGKCEWLPADMGLVREILKNI